MEIVKQMAEQLGLTFTPEKNSPPLEEGRPTQSDGVVKNSFPLEEGSAKQSDGVVKNSFPLEEGSAKQSDGVVKIILLPLDFKL